MKKWYIFLLMLLGWEMQLIAQANVEVRLSQDSLLIGDILTFYLQIQHGSNVELATPNFEVLRGIDSVEFVDEKPWDTIPSGGFVQLEKAITFTAFDSGDYVIPQLRIFYRQNGVLDSLFTPSLPFIVRPVPQDIYPLKSIKPIIEIPISFWQYLSSILPILIIIFVLFVVPLLVLIILLVTLHKKQKQQLTELIPPPPVQVSAYYLTELEALNEQGLWQKGAIKTYHSNLSFLLRAYLEKRYNIQTLESTTSEILEDLRTHLTSHQLDELEWLLRMVDLVKFAKTEPNATFHEEAYQSVKNFITNTDKPTLLLNANTEPVLQASRKKFLLNKTGEEIELALTLSRFWARLIDSFAVLLFWVGGSVLLFLYQQQQGVTFWEALINSFLFALVLLGLILVILFLLEWLTGKTLGKYLQRIKLVHEDGGKLKFGWMLLRSLIFNLSSLIFIVILLVSIGINISTGSRILLHDKWTKTRVISLKNKQKL